MEAPCCSATTSTRRFPVNQIPALHFHVLANQVVPEIALTLRELPTAPDCLKLTFGEYGKQVASTVDNLIGEVGPTGTPPSSPGGPLLLILEVGSSLCVVGQDAIICFSDFAHLQEASPRPAPQRCDAGDDLSTDDRTTQRAR